MRFVAPATLGLLFLLASGSAGARDHTAEGRYHLKKANALAGDNRCAAAVKEFTAAYDKLHDPVVLFNRAECYRRLGENRQAADDYRGFLKGFPGAPNRSEIEARIAALERPAPAPVVAAPRTPPAPAAAAHNPPPLAPAPVAHAPPPVVSPRPAPAVVEAMPFLPPPLAAGAEAAPVLVEAPASPPKEPPAATEGQGSRWWLWTGLAVVLVGGGVAGYVLLKPKEAAPPDTALGNYHF